jgi:transcription termination factor NusB
MLVTGYLENAYQIDSEIQMLADNWSLERMPAVDRAILRLAAWEILHNSEVPNEVAISEAVALAGELSTDDSPKFINGVLARLAKGRQALYQLYTLRHPPLNSSSEAKKDCKCKSASYSIRPTLIGL